MKSVISFSVLLCLLFCSTAVQSGCFEDWSRCSPSTSAATGILWRDCDSYCRVCFDADSGVCVDSPSLNCPGVLKDNKQCKCVNARRDSKKKWDPSCWA